APVVHHLRDNPELNVRIILTGQHRELLSGLLELFELAPEADLQVRSERSPISQIAARVLSGLDPLLAESPPDLLLVQGDTTSAFAAAMAATARNVPVGHVEAGLRTHNVRSPFPEELNRRWIATIAQMHFAPTNRARENLLHEGVSAETIWVTGNTGI